jgi:4-hydroxy-4-methyl-2-oxoglutarate aldolase
MPEPRRLSHGEMLELRRWNTPTIYNGWEQITRHDIARDAFNPEESIDFMPRMGPMVGRAITVVCEPGRASHKADNPRAWSEYRRYVASVPGPKVVIVQDLDKPHYVGAFFGEVNANVHRALGCAGVVVDGAIRDVDEMAYAGFKALAKRLCVGHAHVQPVRWGEPVEVFGTRVEPGQLVHADKHGFIAIPPEDEAMLLEASRFMDTNECLTLIRSAREGSGMATEQLLTHLDAAVEEFGRRAAERFGRSGEH